MNMQLYYEYMALRERLLFHIIVFPDKIKARNKIVSHLVWLKSKLSANVKLPDEWAETMKELKDGELDRIIVLDWSKDV